MTNCNSKTTLILFYTLEIVELTSLVLYSMLIKGVYCNNPEITYESKETIKTVNFYFFTLLFNLLLFVLLFSCGINAITKHNIKHINVSIIFQILSIIVIGLNSFFNFNWTTDSNSTLETITNYLSIVKGGLYCINIIFCLMLRKFLSSELKSPMQIIIDERLSKESYEIYIAQGRCRSEENSRRLLSRIGSAEISNSNDINNI